MNTPADHNPYQPPKANVTPTAPADDGELISGGRAVPTGSGITWIGVAWSLFGKSPGIWIVNTLLLMLMMFAIAIVPFFGGIASNLLTPIFIGGLMLGCKALDDGGNLVVGHLFAGFQEKAGQLALVGLLMFAGTIIVVIIAMIIFFVFFGAALFKFSGDTAALTEAFGAQWLLVLLLFVLVVLALILPLTMAYWFAPALVVLRDLSPLEALKQSFQGCLRNIMPFLLYGIVMLVLLVLALLPFGLGILVLIPMGYASIYSSYKDIFLKENVPSP